MSEPDDIQQIPTADLAQQLQEDFRSSFEEQAFGGFDSGAYDDAQAIIAELRRRGTGDSEIEAILRRVTPSAPSASSAGPPSGGGQPVAPQPRQAPAEVPEAQYGASGLPSMQINNPDSIALDAAINTLVNGPPGAPVGPGEDSPAPESLFTPVSPAGPEGGADPPPDELLGAASSTPVDEVVVPTEYAPDLTTPSEDQSASSNRPDDGTREVPFPGTDQEYDEALRAVSGQPAPPAATPAQSATPGPTPGSLTDPNVLPPDDAPAALDEVGVEDGTQPASPSFYHDRPVDDTNVPPPDKPPIDRMYVEHLREVMDLNDDPPAAGESVSDAPASGSSLAIDPTFPTNELPGEPPIDVPTEYAPDLTTPAADNPDIEDYSSASQPATNSATSTARSRLPRPVLVGAAAVFVATAIAIPVALTSGGHPSTPAAQDKGAAAASHASTNKTAAASTAGGAKAVAAGANPCSGAQADDNNGNIDAVQNGGIPPTFSFGHPVCLVELATYHWNNGAGAPGGTIQLLREGGPAGYSSTQAFAATGGTTWYADVSKESSEPVLLDGSYKCVDSDPTTWSWDQKSGHLGFCFVFTVPYVGTSSTGKGTSGG